MRGVLTGLDQRGVILFIWDRVVSLRFGRDEGDSVETRDQFELCLSGGTPEAYLIHMLWQTPTACGGVTASVLVG